MIPFVNIPDQIRVPLFYAEVDNSQANSATAVQRGLIVGQMLATGAALPDVPILSAGSLADTAAFGQGSMALAMIAEWRLNDSFGELWVLPVADPAAAVAATGSVAFGGVATGAALVNLYVAGIKTAIRATNGMTADEVATALAAAVNANVALPVTAVAATGTLNLTAIHGGTLGNDIDVQMNFYGASQGEVLPPGITAVVTPMASGAGVPDFTAGLANCGDLEFDFIAFPHTDTASLDAMKLFLDDQTGRWSWSQMIYGGMFSAKRGTVGTLQTFGFTRNDQHATIMGFDGSPSPVWNWAAGYCAAAAVSLRIDPARPTHTLPIAGILAPQSPSRFTMTERNTLLYSGVATHTVGNDGTVRIEGDITTYQKNAYGSPDDSYLKIQTLYNLQFILRSLETLVTSKYGRMKLADDGTKYATGSSIVTPSTVRGDIIAQYRELEYNGLTQDTDAFKVGLVCERHAGNPNRLDVLWDGILINQLDIFALLAQFRLQPPAQLSPTP